MQQYVARQLHPEELEQWKEHLQEFIGWTTVTQKIDFLHDWVRETMMKQTADGTWEISDTDVAKTQQRGLAKAVHIMVTLVAACKEGAEETVLTLVDADEDMVEEETLTVEIEGSSAQSLVKALTAVAVHMWDKINEKVLWDHSQMKTLLKTHAAEILLTAHTADQAPLALAWEDIAQGMQVDDSSDDDDDDEQDKPPTGDELWGTMSTQQQEDYASRPDMDERLKLTADLSLSLFGVKLDEHQSMILACQLADRTTALLEAMVKKREKQAKEAKKAATQNAIEDLAARQEQVEAQGGPSARRRHRVSR